MALVLLMTKAMTNIDYAARRSLRTGRALLTLGTGSTRISWGSLIALVTLWTLLTSRALRPLSTRRSLWACWTLRSGFSLQTLRARRSFNNDRAPLCRPACCNEHSQDERNYSLLHFALIFLL